jgi:hypothetical protein
VQGRKNASGALARESLNKWILTGLLAAWLIDPGGEQTILLPGTSSKTP